MTQQWVKLTTVFSGLEADTLRATLELEGIPVLVRGFGVGIFGGGFQGPINDGVDVLVPEDALEHARAVTGHEDALEEHDDDPVDDEI